ncbi:MAG: uracil-DNA glycosylase [Gammaproteobacteria bacterium]
MSDQREEYLDALGIPVWKLRAAPATSVSPAAAVAPHLATAAAASPTTMGWDELAASVRVCTKCALHTTRTQTVFGVGRRDADLLVIGEAPGADEDRQGEPFVGRAGQLLNSMLRAIGSPRSDVYIANILKCRPPGNRDPQPDEAKTCTPYLARQIALVKPRAILAVGRIAAQWLLQTDSPIGRLRGRVVPYGEAGTPLVITYHPAYLLRSPLAKAIAWTDLCLVKDLLRKSQ